MTSNWKYAEVNILFISNYKACLSCERSMSGESRKTTKGVIDTQCRCVAWHNEVISVGMCQRSIVTQTGACNGEHKISRKRVGFTLLNEMKLWEEHLSFPNEAWWSCIIALQTCVSSSKSNAAVTIRHLWICYCCIGLEGYLPSHAERDLLTKAIDTEQSGVSINRTWRSHTIAS